MILYLICLTCLSFSDSTYQAFNQKKTEEGVGNGLIDGNYIGGYFQFDPASYLVYKSDIPAPSIEVKSVVELKKALKDAKSGAVIYLNDLTVFDLSDSTPLSIPSDVTICSGRGKNKSTGALLISTRLNTAPMIHIPGNNVRISGLRIKGPDSHAINVKELNKAKALIKRKTPKEKIDETAFKVYGIPNSNGIQLRGKNVSIDNCEIYGWSHAGIFAREGSTSNIHHNYIHHNQRYGLGYGICLDGGYAHIRANLFDYNRHAIAGTGTSGTSYTADYNVALANSTLQGHIFDMHGGNDRRDGTTLAGDSVHIANNLFFVKTGPAIRIRGIPKYNSNISDNQFILFNDAKSAYKKYKQKDFQVLKNIKPETQVEQYNKRTLKFLNNEFYNIN